MTLEWKHPYSGRYIAYVREGWYEVRKISTKWWAVWMPRGGSEPISLGRESTAGCGRQACQDHQEGHRR